MWYCKYFAIKMMFRCNRNKYSRANDSQEVNKTWLVLLGRVKTMKKSNYLIIFFRTNIRKLLSSFNNWKHRIGCSNSETLFESESLISWKMIGDGQLQNQFSPVQVAHHPIMMSSQNLAFPDQVFLWHWREHKGTKWRKIISDLIFPQTFDPEEGVLRSSIQYTPKVGRFEKIKECQVPKISSTLEGWAPRVDDCLQQWTNWQGGRFLNESSRLYLLSLGKV